MRLFVAADIDDHVRAACTSVAVDLDRALRDVLPSCDLKWVAADKLHITVRFIGHVETPVADRIVSALARPLDEPSATLRLGRPGVFPTAGAARVLWIGLLDGQEALGRMHAIVEHRLQEIGVAPEDRPLTAHLTLARFRTPPTGRAAAVRKAVEGVQVEPAAWELTRLTLYESRLSPKGPTYVPLAHTPLGERAATPHEAR
jgi:2'-5' RNA ligase